MSTVQGPTVVFGAEFPGLAQGAGEFDKIRKSAERARDQFGRFIKKSEGAGDALGRAGAEGAKGLDEAAQAAGRAGEALAKIPPQFDAQLKGLGQISRELKAVVGAETVKRFGQIADEIEGTTDGFDKLRNAVDATGDTLRIFGKRGVDLANAIEDIGDPARRATLALALLKQQANPGPVEKFNRAIGNMGAELELARVQAGPLGLALGAVAGAAVAALAAVGAYVARGIKLIIDDSPKAQARLKTLQVQFDALNKSIAESVTGHADLEHAMAGLSKVIDEASDGYEQMTGGADTLSAALDRFMVGLKIAFPALGLFSAALKALAEIGKNAPPVLKNIGTEINNLASGLRDAADAAGEFFSQLPRRVTGGLGGIGQTLKGWAEAGGEAQLREAERQAARAVEKATRRGGGGGGKKISKEEREKRVNELVDEFVNGIQTISRKVDESFGGGFAAIEEQFDRMRELSEIGKRNAEALASMDAQAMVMDAQFANLASGGLSIAVDGFMNLAGAIGTAFGEMIVGTQTLEGFGRALVGVVADMANQFGSLFLLIGTGMAFIPGMGGWSAGLIAAGIGLKALGAGLGAVASGEVGGRGGGRGAGGAGAAGIDPSRFLRPERSIEPSVTNLKVVILGEEIEKPVTRFMDDVARRGGFRNLATRT